MCRNPVGEGAKRTVTLMAAYVGDAGELRHCDTQPRPSPTGAGEGLNASLAGHRAQIVPLAEADPDVADDVVRRRRVELNLQHGEVIEVILALELARLAADRNGDFGVILAIELIGL